MRRSALRWIIPTFLGLQLALLWLQGAQLHRQNQVLQGLREDIQALTDTLEGGQPMDGNDGPEPLAVPVRYQSQAAPSRDKVAVLGVEDEQAAVSKDLEAAKKSAQDAVKEARETRAKISIEENARKAEETRKVQAATQSWQKWVWLAMALAVLAFGARSVLRRRG